MEPKGATVECRDSSCFSPYLTTCVEECTEPDLAAFDACRKACERQADVVCPP